MNEETQAENLVCVITGEKCVCGGRYLLMDDYCDPVCGLPLVDCCKIKEKDDDAR